MLLNIKKDVLLSAAKTVQKAVPGKSSLQLLECMLLEAGDSSQELTLTGNNLEIAIQCKVPAIVEDNGKTLINARLFCELVEKLPDEEILIQLDGNRLMIKSGASEFCIAALPADAYPCPEMTEPENTFVLESLKDLILQTTFAAAFNDANPVLNGILLSMSNGSLTAAGCDGRRFAIAAAPVENTGTFKAIIPAKTLGELARLIGSRENINLGFSGSTVLFTKPGFAFSCRIIEGEYIAVEKLIQQMDRNLEIRLKNVNDLTCALERVILVSSQSNAPMEFTVTAGKLELKTETEMGRVHETVAVEAKETVAASFWYNPRYLLDATRAIKAEAVIYLSAKGMLLITADNFNFITAPVIKLKAVTIPEKAAA